jgi:hypothetical protein
MFRILSIAVTIAAAMATAAAAQFDEHPRYRTAGYDVNVGVYAELDYYGEWIHIGAHGWVWRPYAEAGWRPYYHGHWVWSDYGWTWVSYERYGWAVYHHGYWTFDPRYGWLWVPGYEWAASRVHWVVVDDYVCWAPLPPPGYAVGYPWSLAHYDVWITVDARHFTDPFVGRHRVRTVDFKSRYNNRSTTRYKAPEVRSIERYKGKSVNKVDVRLDRRVVGNREVKRMELPRKQARIVERHRVDSPRIDRREHIRPRMTTRGRTAPRVETRKRTAPRVEDRSRAKDRQRGSSRVKGSKRTDRREVERSKKDGKSRTKRKGRSKRGGRGRDRS